MIMPRKKNSGFTLIELLVVIAIIGLLSTLAIVALGSARQKSRDARRLADLKQIQTAMEMFNSETGTYPVITSTILLGDTNHTCLGSNGFSAAGGCTGQYISFPKDPSGGYYTYLGNGTDYLVSAVLEGSANNLSGAIAAQPNGGITNSYNSPYGLVGWWKFDEGTSTVVYDSSGMGNQGALFGTPVGSNGYFSPGKVGSYSVKCNGTDDRVSISQINTEAMNFGTGSFTVSFWIYSNNFTASGVDHRPIEFAVGNNNSYFQVSVANSGLSPSWVSIAAYDKEPHSGSVAIGGSNSIPINTWSLVSFVFDRQARVLYGYMNGALANTSNINSLTEEISLAGGSWEMCGWGTLKFAGQLDDVRIYNRALSGAEVKALYDSQK